MQQIKCFPSGLRLIVKPIEGMYSVSCGVMVGTGSMFEDVKQNGYAHFVEHMMFKGTVNRSALDITEAVESIGGQINAYTSKDVTCYYTKTTSEHLQASIDLLSDMMFNSLHDEQELQREQKVILEEITMSDDTPDEVCHELIALALYDKHPLSKSILGTRANIKNASRDKLIEFIDQMYVPSNMVVSIAGKVEFDHAVKLVEKYFEPHLIKRKDREKVQVPPAAKLKSINMAAYKEVEQCHISIGMPSAPIEHELALPIAVMSNIFGGGMSSRLFQSVREKYGLAYSVFSYVSSYVNNAYFEIYIGTNPSNLNQLAELIKQEIDLLIKEGVTEKELHRGKEQLKGALMLSQENTMNVMATQGSYLLKCDKAYDVEKKIAQINDITIEDIKKATEFVFGCKAMSVAYVGRKEHEIDMLKQLC